MPYNRPGKMKYVTATKAVDHGMPVTELGIVGTAVKQKKPASGAASGSPQKNIAISEPFAIISKGIVQVPDTGSGVAAAAVGTPIYIIAASNLLTTSSAGNVKFGMKVEGAGVRGTPAAMCRIDLDAKDAF